MEVMFERVAGLDVGKASVTVCVRAPGARPGRRKAETRTSPTMTRSLGVMRDWLVSDGVTVAAIRSIPRASHQRLPSWTYVATFGAARAPYVLGPVAARAIIAQLISAVVFVAAAIPSVVANCIVAAQKRSKLAR